MQTENLPTFSEHIGFGQRFWNASLSKFNSNSNRGFDSNFEGKGTPQERILEWVQSPQNFLVLSGSPGGGKTWTAAAIANFLKYSKGWVRYFREDDFFEKLRVFIKEDRNYAREMEYLLSQDWIIFDDLGSTGVTDWRKEVLFSAINFLYEKQIPAVFTTNLTKAKCEQLYEPRLASRLFATENTIINFYDDDLRQKGL